MRAASVIARNDDGIHAALGASLPIRIVVAAAILGLIGALTLRATGPAAAAGPGDVTPPSLVFTLEWTGPNSPVHDIILLWDDRLDQSNLPAPTDFVVTFDGSPLAVDAVEFSHDGTWDPTLSLAFMTLYLRDPVTLPGALTVSYTPGSNPIQDEAGNDALPIGPVDVEILEDSTFEFVLGLVDGFYGANHVGIVFSDPVDPVSLPPATAFEVTRNGAPVTPTSVVIFPRFGGRILDLTLPVTFRSGDTATISYTVPGGGGIRNLVGTPASGFPATEMFLLLAAQDAASGVTGPGGGTVSTDAGDLGTTAQDPVATTVSVPGPSTITIDEGAGTLPPPSSDYTFIGETVEIDVDPPAIAESPIVLELAIDGTVLAAAGVTAETVQLFRNGTLVPACTGAAGIADPDPCIESRSAVPPAPDPLSYAVLRVLTSHASTWSFGAFIPYRWSGFQAPVDNPSTLNVATAGRGIPVKFGLGGDRGLAVFRPGFPKSVQADCATGVVNDEVESTVTAGSSSLSFDASSGIYTYAWKTASSWATAPGGPCRRLLLGFTDGSDREAWFRFR